MKKKAKIIKQSNKHINFIKRHEMLSWDHTKATNKKLNYP